MASVTHVAGLDVTFSGVHRRQRCAWCGAVIDDMDLSLVAQPLLEDGSPDESPFPSWPIGALVRIDGALRVVLDVPDDEPVPEDSCMRIDPAVTV